MTTEPTHVVPATEPLVCEGPQGAARPLACTVNSLSNAGRALRLENAKNEELQTVISQSAVAWIDYAVGDLQRDCCQIAGELGFSLDLVNNLLSSQFSGYEDMDVEMGVMVPILRFEEGDIRSYRLIVLMKKAIIVTVHEAKIVRFNRLLKYAPTFMQKIPLEEAWNDKLTLILTRIIDDNNEKNFECLRSIEVQGDELGKQLADPGEKRSRLAPAIYNMKHTLITYLDGLWASLDVVRALRFGDADIVTNDEKLLSRFELMSDDINRQIALGEHMSEVLASGLEVLQTIFNNQLQAFNNRLAWIAAWLAVVGTGMLVPNTLATVFGVGPISEIFSASTTIAILVVSSVVSMAAIYLLIRWKGLIPRDEDRVR